MDKLRTLKQRLQELDAEIREIKKRLPAHSTKPPLMINLLALEDEYDLIIDEIKKINNQHVRQFQEKF